MRRLSYAGAMAACLVIGLGIGWFSFRAEPSAGVDTPLRIVMVEVPAETQSAPRTGASEFWSAKQWLERAERRSPRRRSERPFWESFVSPLELRGDA
jgi:hypothetical protein